MFLHSLLSDIVCFCKLIYGVIMVAYAHSDVLDNGPNYIKNNANKILAVLAYTVGDSYATVTNASNIVAEATLTSGDFTGPAGSTNRTLTFSAGKQDSSANNSGDPTHFVFVDTVNSKVLWVTPETSALSATAGSPVSFPSLTYTSNQPA